MGFSLNPATLLKNEVLKFKDKKGNPEVISLLDDVEKKCEVIGKLVSCIDAADVAAIFHLLPPSLLAKLPPETLIEVQAAIVALPAELVALEAGIAGIEKELKS